MTLFAKSTRETLYEHSIKTYEYGLQIIDMLPYPECERQELKSLASLPLLFHDIGKAAVGFQNALEKGTNWSGKRHELLSAAFLSQFDLGEEQIFSVLTHHKDIIGSKIDKILPENQVEQYDGDTEVLKSMKKEFEANSEEIDALCKDLFQFYGKEYQYHINLPEGIGVVDYWIYGNYEITDGQLRNISAEKRLLASKLRGIIRAADHLASSGNTPISQIDFNKYQITKYRLRHFQKKCRDSNGSIMLMAPTGSGKTEAILLWAQHNQKENSRLFYVLPYQASINAMHIRLSEIFDKKYVGVLHSNSISYLNNIQSDSEEDEIACQTKAYSLSELAREIYYPVRVCTPHQLLRFGLKGNGWEYLLLEFSYSLVIYDEIHAFQPRITGLTLATAKLIKTLGAKVAFASATFPEFLKKLIIQEIGDIYEIKPEKRYESDRQILERKRHNVKVIDGTLLDNLGLIKEEIENGKSVLIIANHVKTAQTIYGLLKEYSPMLLHSRFNKRDRRAKEDLLLSENKPKVVIATQVIEVSLDIDYNMMFTEPAPIDALTQRFGRVNRKGERDAEDIFVMRKQVSKNNLYNKNRTEHTIELLENIQNPIGERDLLSITNEVYKDGYTKDEMEEFNQGYNNEDMHEFEKNLIAGVSKDWVEEIINKNDGSCEVLPIGCFDEFDALMEKGLWVKAKDLLVSVGYNLVRDNISKIGENKDILLVNCKYNSEEGLLTDEKPSNFDTD